MAHMIGPSAAVSTHTAERFRRAMVRVETDGAVYVGRICVPDAKHRVSSPTIPSS